MKGLALETVVKWIIYIVVAGIVINLVFYFYGDIKRYLKDNVLTKEKGVKTEMEEVGICSNNQLRIYMRSCWDKTGEKYDEDVICYILKGDFSNVDTDQLSTAVEDPASVDLYEFDTSKNSVIIKFEDIGNKIVLES